MDEVMWCKKEWYRGMGELLEFCEKNVVKVKHFGKEW